MVDENHMLEAAAGTAFPLGDGHAVGIVVDDDGQADFLFEDSLERDGLPVRDVGEVVDHAFFKIDEAGHADADGGDSRMPRPQILDDADHGVDQVHPDLRSPGSRWAARDR